MMVMRVMGIGMGWAELPKARAVHGWGWFWG